MRFDAVIFDLDGVITKTALVHSSAWKKMFDDYLKQRAKKNNEPFHEFTHTNDYLPFVDGKPRYKGVDDFLKSRGISLPFGQPSDTIEQETVCGLGNRKDLAFNEILKRDGVEVYESTHSFLYALKEAGVKIGVASSSKNCKPVLEAANLLHLFETRVDGVISAELNLKGKPEPHIFTRAADNLGVTYDRTVIIEDAVSGVQAGQKGAFGLVIGVAREDNTQELRMNGADIVVSDLSEINIDSINAWFETGLQDAQWGITYHAYEAEKERTREALLAVGNGYFGTRGALEETKSSKFHSPGTYIAGLYNRLESEVNGRIIENEDFVNVPNWLSVNFRIDGEPWFDFDKAEISKFSRHLVFRTGVLTREMIVTDPLGRQTRIISRRMANMAIQHQAALQYEITPLNYNGTISIKSGIDGDIINEGVERYKELNQQHLEKDQQGCDDNLIWVSVNTTQSGIQIAEAANHHVYLNNQRLDIIGAAEVLPSKAFVHFVVSMERSETLRLEKTVGIYTSKYDDVGDPISCARIMAVTTTRFDDIVKKSAAAWSKIWQKIDVVVQGNRNDQKLLRLHLYHLMVSASPHNAKIDASFTARGLHGEAYRGHIFWDELFILPFYSINFPKTAKATLMYRYNRLDKARENAKNHGYKGAMYPWQSGSDGREETQIVHVNPLTGEWGDDYSSLQRHVSLAIAYNIWEYYHITDDLDFVKKYGAEMFLEICRFWASKAELNQQTGRYSIAGVMGPDEFHEQYPGAAEGGLKDNAYTNILVGWAFGKAFELIEKMGKASKNVLKKTGVTAQELEDWKKISQNLTVVISKDGIISQYDGYFDLKELDWAHYQKKYGNIYRLDRILKAEGKSADEYKVAKQADTLMTFYILDDEEVQHILQTMGYKVNPGYLNDNLQYYLARTSHGSTLSRVVHAQLANMTGDDELSWKLYQDALGSDYNDIQGGTTAEGIHLGVMAGTVLIAMQAFAGLNLRGETIRIEPKMPKAWQSIQFGFSFRGHRFKVYVSSEEVAIELGAPGDRKMEILINGKSYQVTPGEKLTAKL